MENPYNGFMETEKEEKIIECHERCKDAGCIFVLAIVAFVLITIGHFIDMHMLRKERDLYREAFWKEVDTSNEIFKTYDKEIWRQFEERVRKLEEKNR
jgi:hypothetical protein